MSIKRECIQAGFVVTFRQYGEFVGHEFFLTRSELMEQLVDYREAGFTSLEVVGIRHRGRYLSPGAVAVVLDQESWYPPSALSNAGRPLAKQRAGNRQPRVAIAGHTRAMATTREP
jgi:hypothetical protein